MSKSYLSTAIEAELREIEKVGPADYHVLYYQEV